jgi:NAD(P)-dependent dehydrogenase (short-subunit alcohol dehydrogenase family)
MTTVALVTGGNRGIGFESVKLFKEHGITAIVGARDPDSGKRAGEKLGQPWVRLDVTDDESVNAAAQWIDEEYGKLDILVNNAGVTVPLETALPSIASIDDIRRVYETNVFAVVRVTNAMLPLLRKAPAARIVNVSSQMGSIADAMVRESPIWPVNNMVYNSSKTALNMVTAAYAKELWDTPIKVNAADPGWCATEINNYTGFRTAEEGAVVFVQLGTLDESGPSGEFRRDDGPIRW